MGYVVSNLGARWPSAAIPYRISAGISLDKTAITRLNKAIEVWNSKSALKLVHDKSGKKPDHIVFERTGGGGGFSESVGRKGGPQVVAVDYAMKAMAMRMALLHEIGHAAGCIHEHQRPDRDVFIETHPVPVWDTGKKANVGPVSGEHPVGPYDCVSLMHYLDIDYFLDPKPGKCATLSNTSGLSVGDIASLEFLAGGRYQIKHVDEWEKGWTHFAPYQINETEHLISYRRWTGEVQFGQIAVTGDRLKPLGANTWATTWSHVETLELGSSRFVLVYSSVTGLVRIDKLSPTGSDNEWEGHWDKRWTHCVTLGAAGFQRDHVLVYDAKTGTARLDKIDRVTGNPSSLGPGGTINLWERTWSPGYTSVVPYRVSDEEWHVLLYNKTSGEGRSMRISPKGATTARQYSWGKGWTHFMPYAQHSEYSYGTHPYARMLAYHAKKGRAHFDVVTDKAWFYGPQDPKWATLWTALIPCYLGRAGRESLGNSGLIAYNQATGVVHFDRLL